jgi:hypothetical protein
MKRDDIRHAGPRAARPKFIPGVYNYCDHWCERCRFQTRCRLYRDLQRFQAAPDAGEAALRAVAEEDDEPEDEEETTVSPRERAEFLALIQEANKEPSPEEAARIRAACERYRELKSSHPLTLQAREYADIASNVTTVIRPVLDSRADPLALAAIETIDRFDHYIAVKTWRATAGLVGERFTLDDDDEDDDEFSNKPSNLQADCNGCAKLVRLMIAESREAWQVLMHVQTIAADGVPGAMVRRLSELDARVAAAFPRAMEFMRPGFDDGG